MRKLFWLPFLMIAVLLSGCSDATGIGGGDAVSGPWVGTVDREDILVTLTEDRGAIRGSGSWGFDAVTVRGNRAGRDVSLIFEFSEFEPVNFQGTLAGDRMEGWLTGSGFQGEPVSLWRD